VSRSSKAVPEGTAQTRREQEERRVLAGRLHMLRVRRQLSLATVALGTGLSRSFLALLEAGKSDVSISRLLRIAEFYGVWLSDLVGTAGPSVEVVRADEARIVPTDDPGQVQLLSLQSVRTVLPFRIELPAGSSIEGGLSHSGEEFVHCVAGTVDLEVVNAVHRLEVGDTASFPGRLPHTYRNAGEIVAILVGATARYG
jgi:transcriptional regulator with XRE-family HTH domain